VLPPPRLKRERFLRLLSESSKMEKWLPIGKIAGTHGIKGNLKVKTYTETADLFSKGGTLYVKNQSGEIQVLEVAESKPFKQGVRLGFKNVLDINTAEKLVGLEILLDQAELPALEAGHYYWSQLMGMAVKTNDDTLSGHIDSIIETGANDVYVVRRNKGETLIPAIESVVLDIDLEKKIMRVNLPEGL
jgi:16S rRNA processing protein RimM